MKAEEFNKAYPVGTEVIYVDDFKKEHRTKTESEAWETGSGHVLVSIQGKSGGYDIARIKPAATGFTETEILGGYAFKSYEKELQAYNSKRFKEISESGAQIELKKTPAYGHTKFHGKLLNDEAKKLTRADIAIYADHGNLCFGGSCSISGDSFTGSYNTD
jgi:hypothetical protein